MAVAGGTLYWIPKAAQQLFSLDEADLYFGAIACFCGVLGTLGSGAALDRLGANFITACRICSGVLTVSGCFLVAAVWPDSAVGFFTLLAVGYFFLSCFYAPAVNAILWSCEPHLRAQAVGLAMLLMHVFGDVPSPYYTGALQDVLNDWRWTMSIFFPLLFPAAIAYIVAAYLAAHE
eukprot:gene9279-14376_t